MAIHRRVDFLVKKTKTKRKKGGIDRCGRVSINFLLQNQLQQHGQFKSYVMEVDDQDEIDDFGSSEDDGISDDDDDEIQNDSDDMKIDKNDRESFNDIPSGFVLVPNKRVLPLSSRLQLGISNLKKRGHTTPKQPSPSWDRDFANGWTIPAYKSSNTKMFALLVLFDRDSATHQLWEYEFSVLEYGFRFKEFLFQTTKYNPIDAQSLWIYLLSTNTSKLHTVESDLRTQCIDHFESLKRSSLLDPSMRWTLVSDGLNLTNNTALLSKMSNKCYSFVFTESV